MAISSAFNIASGGLTASARMAEVVSSNLSNALTDGYGKRELTLSSGILGGVKIDGVSRLVDAGALRERRNAEADVGAQQRGATALSQLEQAFGPVGDPSGVAGRIAALEQSLISASSNPASEQRLQTVLSRLEDVTTAMRSDSDAIQTQRQDADKAIASDVETLNTTLKQVEKLNADVTRLIGSGNDPSAAIDARQTAIDKITSIVPLTEIDRGRGQVALYTKSGVALIDGSPANFGFSPVGTIVADMTLASGALAGVTLNGDPLDLGNGYGRMKGGSLEAAFVLRDQTLTGLQTGLDEMAADLIQRFVSSSTDPTLTVGDPGLFTDRGAAFDPLDIGGLAARLTVNTNIDPAQGGALSRLRDGVNATVLGPVGNNAQIDSWLGALQDPVALIGGGTARSAVGHASDHINTVGRLRLDAEETLGFETARFDSLKTAELAGGVDSDQELQNLLRIEQSYAANARVLQTLDAMMSRLMEI
ncbi:flagellar hook-associated protein FlgK [Loktanella sp. F6476L]|uniref:flagellar hook-associated protein FlgK n=1 Tax=Loktanella sp. F6476L TaxID=2926405 RepID=UPI001FF39749|nr:flagellar hook-associated protein FlgK [Loktanella sp. F6476L]MCK0120530.1 flagellar hook-associated protein FlgK [Loktanella sp. F6476L]